MVVSRFAMHQRRSASRSRSRGERSRSDSTPRDALTDALRWRKGTILFWIASSVGVGAAALSVGRPSFVATTEIVVPNPDIIPDGASLSSSTTHLPRAAETIRSDDIVRSVVNELRLWDNTEFSNPPSERFATLFGAEKVVAAGSNGDERTARTLANLKSALTVTNSDTPHLVRIALSAEDPKQAADVVGAIARTYVEHEEREARENEGRSIDRVQQLLTQLGEQLSATKQSIKNLAASDVERRRQLEAQVQTYQTVHDAVLREYSGIVKSKIADSEAPRIVSAATAMPSSNPAQGRLSLLITAFCGGLLGLSLATRSEYRSRPIRRGDTVKQDLGVPYLGSVALLPGRRLVPAESVPPLVLHDDQDVLRKALLDVRYRLNARDRTIVLGVTSAHPGDGKSTIAFNMAVVAAEDQARTLLIDADLWQATLSRQLSAPPDASVLKSMREQASLAKHVHKTAYGFDFIGEREIDATSRVSSVLGSSQMTDFLSSARQLYDLVICDLPDLKHRADTHFISASLDTILVVARWGASSASLAHSLRQYEGLSARFAGALINRVPNSAEF
jgi:polysaccharide biosynthesis transport protein